METAPWFSLPALWQRSCSWTRFGLQAIGKPHSLWCAFAKFYEKHGDVANARIIFDKATEVRFLRLKRVLLVLILPSVLSVVS